MGAFPEQDFSSLLDELIARAETGAAEPAASPSISADLIGVIEAAEAAAASGPRTAFEYLRSAEQEMMAAEAASALEQIVVTAPPSIEPQDIALELGLAEANGRELDRARRDFAFANHPDRVESALRERAMVRMQIANQLIDEAKRKAR